MDLLSPPQYHKSHTKGSQQINLPREVAKRPMEKQVKEEISASGSNEICVSGDGQASLDSPSRPSRIRRKSPGGALEFDGNRKDHMAVSRLLSGHLKGMTFESSRKVFQTCSKCHLLPASPEHILDCLGLALEDAHASPLLVLDFARVNGLMELI
ncbi:uncharacterized protein TNIN_182421 [Trichonephila inaurata madagascariensis]|uniref:Uncharacterized protein n=1 Tax=Trichonephila inaurata madagascariensis TaxID=2747483 RepID=A0A8X7C921_9ARAC|nr:uncharacterized protein TNIN_182421 [Trichonephila inaurata madagascariensis]